MKPDVFERCEKSDISDRLFYGLLSLFISIGLAGTATAAHLSVQFNYEPDLFGGFLFCFTIPMFGALMVFRNGSSFTSIIGYNITIIPFGIILGPIMQKYGQHIARDMYIQIMLITCIIGHIASFSPELVKDKTSTVTITTAALFVAIIPQLFGTPWNTINWIPCIIRSLLSFYIGYYFYRARKVPRTVRNSIDVTSRLYVDMITQLSYNMFIARPTR
jgi:FtsH-binding integral membrane protein